MKEQTKRKQKQVLSNTWRYLYLTISRMTGGGAKRQVKHSRQLITGLSTLLDFVIGCDLVQTSGMTESCQLLIEAIGGVQTWWTDGGPKTRHDGHGTTDIYQLGQKGANF
jgi:hypothetical protein